MKTKHVMPIGDERPHWPTEECWCSPFQEQKDLIIHHAKDGREAFERNGYINDSKPWEVVIL